MGSLKQDAPSVRVLATTGTQAGLSRFVVASTTMTRLLAPVMVNPNRFVRTPKLSSLVLTRGFHSTAGRPANVAPQPVDVHSPEKHLQHVCFHELARNAYKETVAWGFVDVFRKLYPDRQQFTFWDYLRPNSVDANKGWRIDHILATASLAERCTKVEVDIEPRRAAGSSDHTFLWAEFAL